MDPKFVLVNLMEIGKTYMCQFQTDPSIGSAAVMIAFEEALSAETQVMSQYKDAGSPDTKIESQTTILV